MTFANPDIDEVLREPLSAARKSARPIVAFASNTVPFELIHAAGCYPLRLPTAPRPATPRADRYLEARFDPPVRAALEQILAGELDGVRLLVLPRTSDSWQRLYYYLCELGRSFGERVPEVVLYDLLHTPWQTSADHNLASTRGLAGILERVSGVPLSDAALAGSIALYDRLRDKLGRFLQRRWSAPSQLAGADALDLYSAAQRLDPAVLEAALDALLSSPPRDAPGMRTLLVGSAHDTPAIHCMIARSGGQVVADYHEHGDLSFGPPIRSDLAPLVALCEHYHRSCPSPRTFPPPVEHLLGLADESRAEAAVFFYYTQEEALTWDYPAQRAALGARGLSTLLLERQEYPPNPAAEPQLREFFATRDPRAGEPA